MRRGYTQGFTAFAFEASKLLVNRRSNEVVNIASTKMMKKLFAGSIVLVIASGAKQSRAAHGILDCFVASLLAMTVFVSYA